MMKKLLTTTLLALAITASSSYAAIGEGEVCKDIACYKVAIKDGIQGCRDRIQTISDQDKFWKHKPGLLERSKRKKLSKLDQEMSYNAYLDHINYLKITTGKTRLKLNRFVESSKDIKEIGLKIMEELAIFKPNCSNAVNAIQAHIEKRKEAISG